MTLLLQTLQVIVPVNRQEIVEYTLIEAMESLTFMCVMQAIPDRTITDLSTDSQAM